MKYASLLFLLLATPVQAATTPFLFGGKNYLAVSMGRTVQITPADVSVHLTPDAEGPNCDTIATELRRREYLFEACATQPDLAACRLLKKGLRILAEGRPDTDTPIDVAAGRAYLVATPQLEGVDQDGLRATAAQVFHVRAENVEILATGLRPAVTGSVIVLYTPDSAFARVSKLVDFRSEDLAQFPNLSRLVSRNSVLACDMANGKASVMVTALSKFSGLDRVPAEAVDAAWTVYRGLSAASTEIEGESSPLVKAALIGFHIATASPATLPDDLAVTPKALFQRLFDLSQALPSLRPFGSREALRAGAFPDISYEEIVGQSWSVQ